MKICLFQPRYPARPEDSIPTTRQMIEWLNTADPASDLIVLPEYANCPGMNDKAGIMRTIAETTQPLLQAAKEAAIRCHALVCVSLIQYENGLYRNAAHLYGSQGQLLGVYAKRHLTEYEMTGLGPVDTEVFTQPTMKPLSVDGVKYNLITCYDIYFPEYVQAVADGDVNLILHPSYQRGERAEIITLLNRARAFDSGAFFIHASYSMGADSPTGGHSMVTTPDGEIAADFGQEAGCFYVEIPALYRHTAASNFGGEIVDIKRQWEKSRKPWLYRCGGPLYAPDDSQLG